MNMVRAGVVDRPDQWQYGSAYELATGRQRYRIVDRQRLVQRLGFPDWDTCRDWYDGGLQEILARRAFMHRQPFWTDSLAVGGPEWVESAAARSGMKRYSVAEADLDWPQNLKTVFLRVKSSSNCN